MFALGSLDRAARCLGLGDKEASLSVRLKIRGIVRVLQLVVPWRTSVLASGCCIEKRTTGAVSRCGCARRKVSG